MFCLLGYSPKKYISLTRSSSNIQLNSSFSSTEACKDTVHVSTLTPMINSTFSTVQQRYWGKTAYSAPQSDIAGATLAARMEQKISQELFNVTLSAPVFVGYSEIILKMIAKNDPAGPPVFYGSRLMEILSTSSSDNWFWCPGPLNPADLFTRSGTECNQINSKFWLQGSFLPQEKSTWPIIACTSLPTTDT